MAFVGTNVLATRKCVANVCPPHINTVTVRAAFSHSQSCLSKSSNPAPFLVESRTGRKVFDTLPFLVSHNIDHCHHDFCCQFSHVLSRFSSTSRRASSVAAAPPGLEMLPAHPAFPEANAVALIQATLAHACGITILRPVRLLCFF